MILAKGGRLRLDLALAYSSSESSSLEAQAPLPSNSSGAKIVSSDKILRSQDLKHLERDSIVAALERAHRRISGPGGAAEILGLNPNTLASRMRSLGIKRKTSD